jgi:hypothetical protein
MEPLKLAGDMVSAMTTADANSAPISALEGRSLLRFIQASWVGWLLLLRYVLILPDRSSEHPRASPITQQAGVSIRHADAGSAASAGVQLCGNQPNASAINR